MKIKTTTNPIHSIIAKCIFTFHCSIALSMGVAFAQGNNSSMTTGAEERKMENISLSKEEMEELRQRIIKRKNPLEVSFGLQGSLTQANESWINTSGGDNAIALLSSFKLSHIFAKRNFRLETSVSAMFGYNRIDTDVTVGDETHNNPLWYKNQDELSIYLYPSYKISEKWSYGATIGFRTQFALGYLSRTQQESTHIMSSFMAPGYLDISGGLVWSNIKESMLLTIRISPIAMSAVYVCNENVRSNFVYQFSEHNDDNFLYTDPYGVYYQDKSKYEGGSSIQVDLELPIDKKGIVTYKTSLHSFYGWFTQVTYDNIYKNVDAYNAAATEWNTGEVSGVRPMLSILPTVRWENSLNIKMTKILSAEIDYKLYFDRAQDFGIQTKTMTNIGLVYTFNNQQQSSKKSDSKSR